MDVQARLRSAEPRLPEEVRRQGILVRKASPGFLNIVAITSTRGTLGVRASAVASDKRRRPKA
jgi:multidrug efflux pump subunit AcrB